VPIASAIGAFSAGAKPLHCDLRPAVAGECTMPTTEEIEELREGFSYNDSNGDGRIDFSEFVAMLKDLEANVAPDEARIGFDLIDTDNDRSIEFDEFMEWWSER
jgi:Ca2+-binding EF-hand superfamily protein